MLSEEEIQKLTDRFDHLISATKRDGTTKLLEWMHTTDFYVAPASTKYHSSFKGGLLLHSLNVYDAYKELQPAFMALWGADKKIMTNCNIICLLHDLCKTSFYKPCKKNRRDSSGKWEAVDSFEVEDQFPYGHGEKSVFLIERFLRLRSSEAMAIRWHMGAFGDASQQRDYQQALNKNPEILLLSMADQAATSLMETAESN